MSNHLERFGIKRYVHLDLDLSGDDLLIVSEVLLQEVRCIKAIGTLAGTLVTEETLFDARHLLLVFRGEEVF